jgi:hypothetical protein
MPTLDQLKQTQVEILKDRLFGPNGLGVQNFHVSLGEYKSTPEQIATEVNKALDAIERGDFKEIHSVD